MLSAGFNKKPTDCLLGACSGRQPMGYRFSLLTLLLSGVFPNRNTTPGKSCGKNVKFCNLQAIEMAALLIGYRRRLRSHQLGESGVFAQTLKVRILIDVIDAGVTFLHRAPQVLQ